MAKKSVPLQKKSNGRLLFLGDSVIHFVIAEFLFMKYKTRDEGFLTRLRCRLENGDSLFLLAKSTDIASYVLVSQNIEILHGRTNVNIIGGGFEAFIGALYMEYGLKVTKEFILGVIKTDLDIDNIAVRETNYKDLILQVYNKKRWGHPEYKIIEESGPDHSKVFTSGLYCKQILLGTGTANSIKKAEQIASRNAYNKIIRKKTDAQNI